MKRALVTSATSSLGKVFAQTLVKEGYELTLHYNSSKTLATQLASQMKAKLIQADLGTQKGISEFVEALRKQEKFDVIINNAGTDEEIDDKDIAAWERVFRINAITPALILGNAKELMSKNGIIINISSAFGHEMFGDKSLATYSATKAAVNSLTRTFAKQLSPDIRVNAIAPGYVKSRWNENYSGSRLKRIKDQQLIERLIEPQEVADLMMHIINNTAFDGEVTYLDGGLNLRTI